MLLAAGRHREALAAYRATLARERGRARSYYGAGRAAELAGDRGPRRRRTVSISRRWKAETAAPEVAAARAYLHRPRRRAREPAYLHRIRRPDLDVPPPTRGASGGGGNPRHAPDRESTARCAWCLARARNGRASSRTFARCWHGRSPRAAPEESRAAPSAPESSRRRLAWGGARARRVWRAGTSGRRPGRASWRRERRGRAPPA